MTNKLLSTKRFSFISLCRIGVLALVCCWSTVPVSCETAAETLQSILTPMKEKAAKEDCNRHRHHEWNVALQVRYADRKKALGLSPDQCLKNLGKDDWGPSGASGSQYNSQNLRDLLHSLIRNESLGIKSFFDAACGDWVFMQHLDLTGVAYIGGDITDSTIEENNRCFANDHVTFVQHDVICNSPPDVDLMMMRDVSVVMKDKYALKALRNIAASTRIKYFVSTTFLTPNDHFPWRRDGAYIETNHLRGENSSVGFREINLMERPFCLPKPQQLVSQRFYLSLVLSFLVCCILLHNLRELRQIWC